jgi:hypothetical protein
VGLLNLLWMLTKLVMAAPPSLIIQRAGAGVFAACFDPPRMSLACTSLKGQDAHSLNGSPPGSNARINKQNSTQSNALVSSPQQYANLAAPHVPLLPSSP